MVSENKNPERKSEVVIKAKGTNLRQINILRIEINLQFESNFAFCSFFLPGITPVVQLDAKVNSQKESKDVTFCEK